MAWPADIRQKDREQPDQWQERAELIDCRNAPQIGQLSEHRSADSGQAERQTETVRHDFFDFYGERITDVVFTFAQNL